MPNEPSGLTARDERLGEVAFAYLEARERGEAPDPGAWLARNPEFAPELADFLADQASLDRLAAPLRAAGQSTPTIGAAKDATIGPGQDSAPELSPQSFSDYDLLEELGRGGSAVVYKARQRSLDRLVALKLLRSDALAPADERPRFRNEAAMIAHLDHPAIVPVYEVGDCPGGLYFTMKLLEGGTLSQWVRGVGFQPASPARGAGPGHRSTSAPATLSDLQTATQLVAEVARAVHHAHQRGILHRDLKPSNILLDAEGRPHVADFGLGRRVEGDSGLTQTGAIVGTPSYMAPEQASPRAHLVTTATDVYGLGAILYALLTGRPPFQGATPLETLDRVRKDEPVAPRRLNRVIPGELEIIVAKAMEKNPEERYASAKELADDLERFLKDEPIRARRPPIARRVRGWCRRHKLLVTGSAVLLFTVLLFGGGYLWSQDRQRAATAEAARKDLAEADLWQKQDHWPKALQALERASGRLQGNGLDALQNQVEERRRQAALVARLNDAQVLASQAYADGTRDFKAADQAYARAFGENGMDVAALAPGDLAGHIRASAIRGRLVTALDHWAYVKERLPMGAGEPLRAIARLADDDRWRKQLRNPAAAKELDTLKRLAEEEGVLNQPPVNLLLLCYLLDRLPGTPGPWSSEDKTAREKAWATTLQLLRQAQERYPADFWLNLELGSRLSQQAATLAEAVGYLRAALAIQPRSPVVYNNLGIVLLHQRKEPDAEAAFRKAIALQPTNAGLPYNLGAVLRAQGKLSDAVAAYRKSIKLQPDYAQAYINLGNVLQEQKEYSDAVEAYRKAIVIQPKMAAAHYNLGNALSDQNKLPLAIAAYRQAIELQPSFALAHYNLGIALQRQGKLPEAEGAYREAIRLKQDYAEAYYNLGLALEGQRKLAEAEKADRKAIELNPRNHEAFNNLGVVLGKQQRLAEAEAAFRQAIELQSDFAPAYSNLHRALINQGHFTASLGPHAPAGLVQKMNEFAVLDAKLSKILSGDVKSADAAECLALAELCRLPCRQLHTAETRFYAEAFSAEPKLADDLAKWHRYNAACAAALAGCGQGKDGGQLEVKELFRLREQALAWLRADLDGWRARLVKEPTKARAQALQKMLHWQRDSDFNGVRGEGALAKLPEGERREWQKFWQEVEELRKRAGERP